MPLLWKQVYPFVAFFWCASFMLSARFPYRFHLPFPFPSQKFTPERKKKIALFLGYMGYLLLLSYEVSLWYFLERPPLRTLGETRMIYATFLPLLGWGLSLRVNKPWILTYTLFLSFGILTLQYIQADVLDKTMMPALRSPWFIPHVLVYILAYSFLSVSFLLRWNPFRKSTSPVPWTEIDGMARLGFILLTFGLGMGALWAKEAWGHYWSWDPKETWAFLTWMSFLFFIHLREVWKNQTHYASIFLGVSFITLLLAWFGVGYLPGTQNSIHSYGSYENSKTTSTRESQNL